MFSPEDWKNVIPLEIGVIIVIGITVAILGILINWYCAQFEWILDKCCCSSCLEAYREHLAAYYDLSPRDLEAMV